MFRKLLESFPCITCHEKSLQNLLCKKISGFFKNYEFWIDCICFSIYRKFPGFWSLLLPDSIGIWLMLDQSKLKNFQFLSFWPNFFYASFMFRIHMHCTVFCIHLAILQLYVSLFSHITCIHFVKLGTQLDLKIDWLIFESFVHFSIYNFLCVNCRKFFS